MTFGFWSLIPVAVIIVSALLLKDTFVSLLLGIAVGFVMIAGGHPIDAFNGFLDSLYGVMTDENTAWVLLICGLFGALIKLITEAGGALGFSRLAEKS